MRLSVSKQQALTIIIVDVMSAAGFEELKK